MSRSGYQPYSLQAASIDDFLLTHEIDLQSLTLSFSVSKYSNTDFIERKLSHFVTPTKQGPHTSIPSIMIGNTNKSKSLKVNRALWQVSTFFKQIMFYMLCCRVLWQPVWRRYMQKMQIQCLHSNKTEQFALHHYTNKIWTWLFSFLLCWRWQFLFWTNWY